MVLSRALWVLLVLAAGCGQSLFDAHGRRDGGVIGGDDGGGGDDGSVPVTCPADACLGDVAADFTNAQGGVNGHWRYLEDKRNRTWLTMTPSGSGMIGAETGNRIEPCTGSSAAGCRALGGALLVSSSGLTADPAIEYRSFESRVIQLALRVHIDSTDQRVRLYRNSREDVLFTALASAGDTVMTTVTVDAIVNDKFLVALEPVAGPGTAAVQLFIIDAKTTFPQTCQLAVPFTSISGNSVNDLCGGNALQYRSAETPTTPLLTDDPFLKPNGAGYFEPSFNYRGTKALGRGGDYTLQLWVRQDPLSTPPPSDAWLFSDLDENNGGGLGLRLRYDVSPYQLEAAVLTSTMPVTYKYQGVSYQAPNLWHFVRVIFAGGVMTMCLDGTRQASSSLANPISPNQPPSLGRNGIWDTLKYYTGSMDDVRVFSRALPCE
jgi:hypothetical protein